MILDATSGYRGIWFDKNRNDVVYVDRRRDVKPTIIADFTKLPFKDECFDLEIFDPPQQAFGAKSEMAKRYGCFKFTVICAMVKEAAKELYRVLKQGCFLNFKWNTVHEKWLFDTVKLEKVIGYFSMFDPLVGQRTAKRGGTRTDGRKWSTQTFWCCLAKPVLSL